MDKRTSKPFFLWLALLLGILVLAAYLFALGLLSTAAD